MCVFMRTNVFDLSYGSQQIRYLFLQVLYLSGLISSITFALSSGSAMRSVTDHLKKKKKKSPRHSNCTLQLKGNHIFFGVHTMLNHRYCTMSKVQEFGEHPTSVSSGEGWRENQAIKGDKVDGMIVDHCCVFGRLFLGVILLHYLLLSGLYSTLNKYTNFLKVHIKEYEAVNDLCRKHWEIILI